jgi:hypothetical protein
MDNEEALAALIGGHLDAVSFVMDYVEFRINYNVLRALSPPQIRCPDERIHEFPQPGSRDALCSLIDSTVLSTAEIGRGTDDWRIEVRTDRGHVLSVPLDPDRRRSVEAAHLVPADATGGLTPAGMWIW